MNKDRRKDIDRAIALLNEIKEKWLEVGTIATAAGEGEREYYDNMNENLQGGDKGSQADNAACQLEEVANTVDDTDIDELIGKLEEAKT